MLSVAHLPLSKHELFHTRSVDEARECVAKIFCPHVLRPRGAATQLDARHHSVRLHSDISLNYVQYGPAVDIEPGYLRDFYLLQIPVRGGASIRCGGQQVTAHERMASIPSPTENLRMTWGDDSPHYIVLFAKSAVHQHAQMLMQKPLVEPLVFDLGLSLDEPQLSPLFNYVKYLYDTVEVTGGFSNAVLAKQAQSNVLSNLLLLTKHNYSSQLAVSELSDKGGGVLLPGIVKRAQDYMQAHAHLALSLADICHQLGVSARSLQQIFRTHLAITPMDYWRDVKLDKIREGLQKAKFEDCTTVSKIANDFGVLHLGHFAEHYKRRFGEHPKQTLHRAKNM